MAILCNMVPLVNAHTHTHTHTVNTHTHTHTVNTHCEHTPGAVYLGIRNIQSILKCLNVGLNMLIQFWLNSR